MTVDAVYQGVNGCIVKTITSGAIAQDGRIQVKAFILQDERDSLKLKKPTDMIISWDIFTARKRSLGQGNIFRSVCQEFCPQGRVCLSACWDTIPLPPGAGTPPPGAGTPLSRHPPDQASPPSRAYWEIQSTSGRYASYWNAILLTMSVDPF